MQRKRLKEGCRRRLVGRGAGRWDEQGGREVSRDDAVVRLQGRRKEEPRREPVPVTGPPAGRRTRHTAPYHPLPLLFLSSSLSLAFLRPVFHSSHLCLASFGLPAQKCLPRPSAATASSSFSSSSSSPLESFPPSRNLSRRSDSPRRRRQRPRRRQLYSAALEFFKQCQPACSVVCADNATGATMFTGPRLYASRLPAVADVFACLLVPCGVSPREADDRTLQRWEWTWIGRTMPRSCPGRTRRFLRSYSEGSLVLCRWSSYRSLVDFNLTFVSCILFHRLSNIFLLLK